jgi:hypothetical protein
LQELRTAGQIESTTAAISTMAMIPAPVSTAEDTAAKGLFIMPYIRNSQFIGQDTHIKDLSTRLEKGKGHTRVALVGLGGIG